MPQPDPSTDSLLYQLRRLNKDMHQAFPDAIQMRQFRDLFAQLDKKLSSGDRFPRNWVTQANQVKLPTEKISAGLSHFDEDPHMTAWCGHTAIVDSDHCTTAACENFIGKHQH